MNAAIILQLLIVGLALGSVYALIALGYTMVYGIIELINFAHGDIFMIGAFVTLTTFNVFGIVNYEKLSLGTLIGLMILACAISVVICAILGVVIERVAYRPLRNAPRLAPLNSAIGVSLVLENIGILWKGLNFQSFPIISPINPPIPYAVGPVSINNVNILVIVVALVSMIALQLFITRTRTGRAMRAVAQDREAAALMGVNVDRTIAITFLIGAGLAGVAGFIYVLQASVKFDVGFEIGLIAFTAAVLGGIGNIIGAMLGGVLIGLVEAYATLIPDSNTHRFGLPNGGAAWGLAVVFAILILILVFRPSGLLGQNTPEKV